jgi:hypothetical protein
MSTGGIGGTTTLPGNYRTGGTEGVTTQQTTGSGVNGVGGETPEIPKETYSAVMSSIQAMLVGTPAADTEVLLIQIAVEMKKAEDTNQKEKIKVDQEAKRTALTEKETKLKEATEKIEKAISDRENASIWDKIKMAFEFLGAILMAVVGAILIATGAGVAIGAMMIAGAVVSLIMAVDSVVQQTTGMGIAGNMAYAVAKGEGKSEKEAKEAAGKADMGFRISMAIIGLALAIGGGVAAFKAPMQVATAAQQVASTIAKAASVADNVTNVATGASDIAAGVHRYNASTADAEANQLKADGKDMEAMMKQLDDFIDQALQRLIAASDRFNAILDTITDSIQDHSNTLSRAKFTG